MRNLRCTMCLVSVVSISCGTETGSLDGGEPAADSGVWGEHADDPPGNGILIDLYVRMKPEMRSRSPWAGNRLDVWSLVKSQSLDVKEIACSEELIYADYTSTNFDIGPSSWNPGSEVGNVFGGIEFGGLADTDRVRIYGAAVPHGIGSNPAARQVVIGFMDVEFTEDGCVFSNGTVSEDTLCQFSRYDCGDERCISIFILDVEIRLDEEFDCRS